MPAAVTAGSGIVAVAAAAGAPSAVLVAPCDLPPRALLRLRAAGNIDDDVGAALNSVRQVSVEKCTQLFDGAVHLDRNPVAGRNPNTTIVGLGFGEGVALEHQNVSALVG